MPKVAQIDPATVGLAPVSSAVGAEWWRAFNDDQLNHLVDAALTDNPTLARALARLRHAQAEVEIEHAGQLPQADADGEVLEQRFSNDYLIPPPYAGSTHGVPTVQANLSWDLDLFGRQRALVDQARSFRAAAGFDAAEARLLIATSISQTYVGLVQAKRQIEVAQAFVQIRSQALEYTQARVHSQLSSNFDLRTVETLLARAQQAQVRAERQRDNLIHALAALVGRGADFYPDIMVPTLQLDSRPVVPDVLPVDLLGRRPDLLAGQARIDAAVAGRSAAKKDFLPNINLQGLAGLASIGFGNFLTSGAGTYGAGAAIHVPIFEGGRLRAQYRGATADLDVAVADYDDTVLRAVRETADALTSVRSTDVDLADQRRVVAGLLATVRLDRVRVATGLGSSLDAIDSGFRLLEAEQALINLQADALSRRVELFAALGGGFNPNAPPAAAASADKRS